METLSAGVYLETKQHGKSTPTLCRLIAHHLLIVWGLERFESFWDVTRNALLYALAEHGYHLNWEAIERLMAAYDDSMFMFNDVNRALSVLGADPNIMLVIFSNGTPSMVSNSVLKRLECDPSPFEDVVTVEHVKQYKPARAVYEHLAGKVGKSPSQYEDILW